MKEPETVILLKKCLRQNLRSISKEWKKYNNENAQEDINFGINTNRHSAKRQVFYLAEIGTPS